MFTIPNLYSVTGFFEKICDRDYYGGREIKFGYFVVLQISHLIYVMPNIIDHIGPEIISSQSFQWFINGKKGDQRVVFLTILEPLKLEPEFSGHIVRH